MSTDSLHGGEKNMYISGPQILNYAKEELEIAARAEEGVMATAVVPAELQNSHCSLFQGLRWFGFQVPKSGTLAHDTGKVQSHFSGSQLSIMAWSQGHLHRGRDQDCSGWPAATVTSQALELGKVSLKKIMPNEQPVEQM